MKTLILIGLQTILFLSLAQLVWAQENRDERRERREREKKEARKLAKKLESAESKRIQTNRRLYKARADAFSAIGNEIEALQYYDSALNYIRLDEREDIEEARAKKKEWQYPKDYLDIVRRLGFIHANNASYQLADSLLSWHTEVIKKQEGANDSEYADALADLAELYRQQGNIRKADSILIIAEPIVKRARQRVGVTNFLKDYLNAVLATQLTRDGYNFYVSALPNAKQIMNMVTQMTTQYPVNTYAKSIEFRQDTRARYIYNLQEINKVKLELNNFKIAEQKIMLALKETEKRFPDRKVYENQRERTEIDIETEKRLKREYEANKDLFMRERALVLSSAADLYIRQGNFDKADSLLEESMYTVSGNLRVLHEDDATVLSGYESYLHREEYGKAREWLDYAMEVYRENLGTDHVAYLRAVIKLGQLYQLQEREIDAEHIYNEVSSTLANSEAELKGKIDALMALEAEKDGWLLKFAKQISMALKTLGRIPDWINDFINANEIKKQKLGEEIVHLSAKTALRITLLTQMADLYITRANYKKAENNLNEVLKYYESNSLDKSIPYVLALSQIIKAYEGLGDKRADEMRTRRREILKAILGEDNINYSFDVLRETPIKSEGDKEILLKALANIKNQKGENSLSYAEGLYLLGEAMANANSIEEASKYYESYLATVKNFSGENSRAYAEALYKFGLHQKRRKQYSQALVSFNQSQKIYLSKKFDIYHPSIIDIIGSTADLYAEWNRLDSAEANYKVEVERILHRVGNVFPSLDESSREKFISKMNTRLGIYQAFILKQLQKNPNKKYLTALLYDEVLATKALLFNTNNKIRNAILSSNDTSALNKYRRVREKRDFLMKAQLKTAEELKAESIDLNKIDQEIRNIETELTAKFPIYAESLQEKKYSWKQVQAKLRGNTAAVEIVRIGTNENPTYVALIVKPTTKDYPELVIFPNGLGMESNLLKAAKNQIQKGSEVKTNPYSDFWQPLGSKLISSPGVKPKVYLSLDGVYNQLSINALKNPQTNRYVVEDFDLQFIASTRDLIEEKAYTEGQKDNFASWTTVMLGFPKYDHAPKHIKKPKERVFAMAYGDLEGTKAEVEEIEKIIAQRNARCLKLMNEHATEDTIKRLKVNPHILHIATHGFFIKTIDGDEDNSGTNVLPEKILKENALSLTGLLLAGAKYDLGYSDNREDGIFTAYEAMNLNLNNTELVALSACETGLGEVKNGEGVYGMQRAFQSAGAKTILMSLWKVDDQATKILMTKFYENWLKSGNRRDAFQKAQLALKATKEYSSPQFWGAFVMVGQ